MAYISQSSNFTCIDCLFESNNAIDGGCIYLDSQSVMDIRNSTIRSNQVVNNGAVAYISESGQGSVIDSCIIEQNNIS